MQTSILSCMCGKGQLITDVESGEIACNKCGLVTTDRVQENRAEWRTFGSDSIDRSRVGSPTSLAYHDMGLATVIGKENKDSSGRQLDASMSSRIQRLRTWDLRTKAHSSSDRNLLYAFNELDRLKDKLGLSDAILEKTAYVYRKAQEKQLVRGRSISSSWRRPSTLRAESWTPQELWQTLQTQPTSSVRQFRVATDFLFWSLTLKCLL